MLISKKDDIEWPVSSTIAIFSDNGLLY